ncbi:Kinesin heavy chain [Candida viswanathii]|uniref:Kinesin heavy chain n=1 Tax=Candida viswanathii TaxID=5486 RepID=A0A367YCC7_9ASCO|nr:Kinesin heavy chain [Candida viswanathii]
MSSTRSFDGDISSSSHRSIEYYDDSIHTNTVPSSPFNFLTPSQARTSTFSLDSSITTINNIKVVCRFRPENELEVNNGGKLIVEFPNSQTVTLHGKDYTGQYTFDRIFTPQSTQLDIYQFSIAETVDDLINGYNGTVLAYGQTGSGKSYTMLGGNNANSNFMNDPESFGIAPRISHEIFERITANELESNEVEYTVEISFMEIYLEQIKDLIDTNNNEDFTIHEDKLNGVYVKGLTSKTVTNELELLDYLQNGLKYRSIASTQMNQESSRSHTIFHIKLTQKHVESETIKRSNLFLVDLAGSEKIDKTGAQGQSLQEAKKINSSLSALGNVINALTDGKSTHIPYRDSKLTRILQESIGGNSRTSLIINCSPSSFNELETLSTLRFGTRAKSIKNSAHVNTELSTASLKNKIMQLEKINQNNQAYIKQLEDELSSSRSESSPLMFSMVRNSTTSAATSIATKPSLATFQSRLPTMPSTASIISTSPSLKASNITLTEELDRRDKKIEDLENVILNLKMQNLKTAHQEESKLFSLENSLHNISNKLNEVELINVNLRKHLLISEKIIESRDNKINKLKLALKDQQLLISRETLGFRNRLGEIQMKLEDLNKYKEEEMSIKRETLLLQRQQSISSSKGAASSAATITPDASTDDVQSISEIIPDPELIDQSFDDFDHSKTLVNASSEQLKQALEDSTIQNGFSIYSSKKLDDLKPINFQQEYISISEFLKESRRRSLLMAPPNISSASEVPSPKIPELDSSDTSGMFNDDSPPSSGGKSRKNRRHSSSSGLNLKIVKPLKSASSLGLFNS